MVEGKHIKPKDALPKHIRAEHISELRRFPLPRGRTVAVVALCAVALGTTHTLTSDATELVPPVLEGSRVAVVSSQTSNAVAPAQKNETVHAYTSADGSVKRVEVSDVLTNPQHASELLDSSTLADITPTYGETYRGSGSDMVWDAAGNDVLYRGVTDRPLPMRVKVTYTLDGEEVSAQEIAGKSGKVSIRYDYERVEESDINAPLIVITGLVLDNDVFSDVKSESGEVVKSDDDCVVIGYSLFDPTASDDGASDAALNAMPTSFEVTATAKDFALDTTLTIASSGLIEGTGTFDFDIDVGGGDDSEGPKSWSSHRLKEELLRSDDGSNKLLADLKGLSGELQSDLKKMAAQSASAKEASERLASDAHDVAASSDQLADDTAAAQSQLGVGDELGSNSLSGNVNPAYDTASQMIGQASVISSTLDDAVQSVDAAVGVSGEVETDLGGVVNGSASGSGLASAESQADALAAEIAAEKTQVAGVGADLGIVSSDAGTALSETEEIKTSISMIKENLSHLTGTQAEPFLSYIQAIMNASSSIETDNDTIATAATAIKNAADTDGALLDAATASDSTYDAMIAEANAISSAVAGAIYDITGAQGIEQDVAIIRTMLEILKSGDGTTANGGLQGAVVGTAELATSAEEVTLNLDSLRSKIPDLISTVSRVATGSDVLKADSDTLAKSLQKFDEAMDHLADSADDATDEAEESSDTLKKFSVKRVANTVTKVEEEVYEYVNPVVSSTQVRGSASVEACRNFTGIPQGTAGSVKFVYETDPVKEGLHPESPESASER